MKTHRPGLLLWFAREHRPDEQYDSSARITSALKAPASRSTIIVGDEPDEISVADTIEQLPLSYKYTDQVVAAAQRLDLGSPKFLIAVIYRVNQMPLHQNRHLGKRILILSGVSSFHFQNQAILFLARIKSGLESLKHIVTGEAEGLPPSAFGFWSKIVKMLTGGRNG
jgi:hypothetical protein